MRWPTLVWEGLCRTPIRLVVEDEGVTEDGAPREVFSAELFCNWQESGGTALTEEQKYVRGGARAYFPGDICPEVPVIASGYGVVFGRKRPIVAGIKARNPDGTVSFTEVRFR